MRSAPAGVRLLPISCALAVWIACTPQTKFPAVNPVHDAGMPDAGAVIDSGPPDAGDAGSEDGGCDDADASACPCPVNFHRCSGICQLDENPQFCGDLCMTCPEPANANATCNSNECGLVCINNTHMCGSGVNTACVTPGPDSCGPGCLQCPTAANATPVCITIEDGGEPQCDLSCDDGFVTCALNGACATTTDHACSVNADCCGGLCQQSTCCAQPGTPCAQQTDCNNRPCSGVPVMACQNQLCCLPAGAKCTQNSDCCAPDGGMGNCENQVVGSYCAN